MMHYNELSFENKAILQ